MKKETTTLLVAAATAVGSYYLGTNVQWRRSNKVIDKLITKDGAAMISEALELDERAGRGENVTVEVLDYQRRTEEFFKTN